METILKDIVITNEPARIECGAPDYVLTRKGIPLGYIEAKDLNGNLDNKSFTEQFNRYRNGLNNLIITNYLEFRFYRNATQIQSVIIGHIEDDQIVADPENFPLFTDLIYHFCTYQGQTIRSGSKLAEIMAGKARLLADIIRNALKSQPNDYDNKTLQNQKNAFEKVLINDITDEEFADVYAQTIAYGMFAGRLNNIETSCFSRQNACESIPKSNPFLRNLFSYIAGPALDDRIKWIVDDLAEVFVYADLHNILKNFGKATGTRDPVIHFYETFLSAYNPQQRKARGVWYTPQPVVNFIVRAVDDLLKSEFDLPEGLADTSKIKIKIKDSKYGDKKSGKRSSEIEKEVHRIQILDPAAGTGTFLAEVIRQTHEKFLFMQGAWSSYVEQHLLPRIHGFEILMASYAMAHLKLDLLLKETGFVPAKNDRLKIYLTNSLEEPHPDTGTLFAGWLSQEAEEANQIKRDVPVMVVLGNPPYSGESSNKGAWINNLISCYKKEPDGNGLKEKNFKWLNDDYVKFIRYAEHFIEKNNYGIIAYINSHGFLDNPTFRGMRWHLLNTFDKIYIIDLHGNTKKKELSPDSSKDENVFDIQQGVSINLFIKTGKKEKDKLAETYHYDLFGNRRAKYDFLSQNGLSGISFSKILTKPPFYFFVPKDFQLSTEYDQGFSLQDLFPAKNVGIVTARDKLTIHQKEEDILETIVHFSALDVEEARNQYKLGKDVRDWSVQTAQQDLKRSCISKDLIVPINYRPFDIKYTYYTGRSKGFHCYPRQEIMKHFINRKNIGLAIGRQGQVVGNAIWNLCFITKNIIDLNLFYRGGELLFPLYLYEETDNIRRPNFDKKIIQKITDNIHSTFTPEKTDEKDTFAPIDVLDYIYAVLHSLKYRETYKEFLKIDFPRVPYPTDQEKFWKLVKLGARIRKIHLLESDELNTLSVGYPVDGENIINKQTFEKNKIYINKTQYFDNVPETAWNFFIGGYQPAQKWLKDRKGQKLSFDDIRHYQKIINALFLTDRIMYEIDQL